MDYHENYFEKMDQLWGSRTPGSAFTKHRYYRGIRLLKNPFDLWNYQELIWENDIQWIVECGTHSGGSALYFGDILDNNKAEGRVISIDISEIKRKEHPPKKTPDLSKHPKIEFLIGTSIGSTIVAEVEQIIRERTKPLLLILDSNHLEEHVFAELEIYVPFLKSGDYLVVEDTASTPGPRLAIRRFTEENPEILERDIVREGKMGFTFHPEGYYKVK